MEVRPIAFVPHKRRLDAHRVEYLKAINETMDYPYQSEDGRPLAPIQEKLHSKCVELSSIPYWVFTDCCTDSLQIAVSILTNENDIVIAPAYGWRAGANAIRFLNRRIKFIDIDYTGNICIEKLEEYASSLSNVKEEDKPKAILVIHHFGTIVNCTKIKYLFKKYGIDIKIIEDAAQSFYMRDSYSYIPGSSSDVTCYSFDFTKSPGTLGSGGAIATKDVELYNKIYVCTAHGASKQKEVVNIGTKSYLDNVSCAVLLKEIQIFEELQYRKRKVEIATWYKDNLPYESIPGENYIWARYTILTPLKDSKDVLESLRKVGCLALSMYREPLHKLPFLTSIIEECPVAEDFSKRAIMIPCHQYLEQEELDRVKSAFK